MSEFTEIQWRAGTESICNYIIGKSHRDIIH